jgi:hypothetical protein
MNLGAETLSGANGTCTINNTMDVYGHLMKDVNSEAPLKLQNAIFKKSCDIGG